MGCTQSIPKEPRAPKEPLPDVEAIKRTKVEAFPGEPKLTDDDDDKIMTMVDPKNSRIWALRQTRVHSNGKTFEIAPIDAAEENKDDLLIEPGMGIGGQVVRRMMQDLVVLHRNKRIDEKQTPICFAVKDVPVGPNVFKILSTKPGREGQAPSIFKGPNKLELYTFASITFDFDTHVCSIKIVGQGKEDTPLYTCRQCDKETWVIRKHGKGVIAQIKQVKGLMPKFTSWDVTMSPGVDAAFICCMANIIDWFVDVLKKQWITYYE